MINNMELFLFIVVFLQPFALFLFFFSRPPPFESLFVLYTMVLYPFLHQRVSQVLGVSLSPFAPP